MIYTCCRLSRGAGATRYQHLPNIEHNPFVKQIIRDPTISFEYQIVQPSPFPMTFVTKKKGAAKNIPSLRKKAY